MPKPKKAGPTLALTGATGFVGAAILEEALKQGWRVKALTRRPQGPRKNLEWVGGDLTDHAALGALVQRADAVFHAAGAIKARNAEGFMAVNRDGTKNVIAAAKRAKVKRFILVSSLAAREPHLSAYAASKHAGEDALKNSGKGLAWAILRPPAVYGPGDREILRLFKTMKRGIAPTMAPANRFSLMHVEDLARFALALIHEKRAVNIVAEAEDGKPDGYAITEVAAAAEKLFGRRVRVVAIPKAVLSALALLNEVTAPLVGVVPMVTRGKLNEIHHPDWVADGKAKRLVPAFKPAFTLEKGLAHTLHWYRGRGWL